MDMLSGGCTRGGVCPLTGIHSSGRPTVCLSTAKDEAMDTWTDWVAIGIAALAALFAGWQAVESRAARQDAAFARREADAAAESASEAQRRSAEALTAIATIAREQREAQRAEAEARPNPWRIEELPAQRHGRKWLLVHSGNAPVHVLGVEFEPKPDMMHLEPLPFVGVKEPGDSLIMQWMMTGGTPQSFKLSIRWRWTDSDEEHRTNGTLR